MLEVLKRQKRKFLYYILVLALFICVIVLATVWRNDAVAAVMSVVLLIYLYVFINALDHCLKNAGSLRLIRKSGMESSLDDLPDHVPGDRDFKDAPAGMTSFADSRILCGADAFVSDTRGLTVLPYSLIAWVYPQHTRVFGSKKLGEMLMVQTVDGQSFDIGMNEKEEGAFLDLLMRKNSKTLIGYSKENRQRYKDICRDWKNKGK